MKGVSVWCPQMVEDDTGHQVPCRILATVDDWFYLRSTSGPVLHVVTSCLRHRGATVLWENLEIVV